MTSVSLVVWKIEPCCSRWARISCGVHQVAVVRQRNLSLVALHADRLGVQQGRIAGGGIARVADGQRARQLAPGRRAVKMSATRPIDL